MQWRIASRPQLLSGPGVQTRVEMGEPRFARHWLAADLGQAADYTALVAGQTFITMERTYQRSEFAAVETLVVERPITTFRIIAMHRPRLGSTYPVIARQIGVWLEDLPDADLIVDATGVGRGVVDILRSQNLRPIAVTITAGFEVNKVSTWDIRVPKTELVSALIAASQQDRLRVAPTLPLRDVLSQEIAAFSPRHTATGLTTYEGRDGSHDDLVLAVSLGVWHQDQPRVQPARLVQSYWMAR